jgi:DNA invertase Pin-like site-specific DNA recombinase
MRVALYARVSTAQQQSIPFQLEALRDYAKRRGWIVLMEKTEMKSGADVGRGERAAVIAAARARQLDAVLVWKLDRWGRSLVDLVSTLHELDELGVRFVSVTEGFDLTSSGGRMLAGMLAVFAEFEREIRRERQAAGIARARRDGRHLGRPKEISIPKRRKVRELAAQGYQVGSIAHKLRIGRTSVRRILAAG